MTYAIWRNNYDHGENNKNSAFWYVDSGYKRNITKIVYSHIHANEIPKKAVRMDIEYNNPNAEYMIYAWLTDNGTMCYWTNADITMLADDSNALFSRLRNVTEIDTSGIDTSSMKDMSSMFKGCTSLKFLDLSSFDTSNVIDMSFMFDGCYELTSIDLSSFDTSMVRDMSYMFYECSCLKDIDVSGWDISNVEDMSNMFYEQSAKNLYLSSTDMSLLDVLFMYYNFKIFGKSVINRIWKKV